MSPLSRRKRTTWQGFWVSECTQLFPNSHYPYFKAWSKLPMLEFPSAAFGGVPLHGHAMTMLAVEFWDLYSKMGTFPISGASVLETKQDLREEDKETSR